jgi:Cu(I)/Ag(I) efflux system membrane fusion protein
LRALGIAQSRIKELEKSGKVEQRVKTFSPQNGVVSELKVRDGMYVKPSTEILSLADLKRVWVLADVFESQADWVRIGQDAVVTLPYLPGREWKGKVSYIYPSLDPKTRSLKVRLQFDNPGEDLKPEMYADITILAKPKKNTLSVPREAVIITGESTRVVKALGNGRFKPVEVKVGIETDNRMEIISGLEEGEEVVTSAQFLIDSESSLRGGFQRITDPATDKTMPASKATMESGTEPKNNDQGAMAP